MQRVVNQPDLFSRAQAHAQSAIAVSGFPLPNGYGRRFASQCVIDTDFVKEAFAVYGITSLFREPMFGNFIGNNYLDGAFVHLHKDPAPPGYHHVRCNFALQMPTEGGNPLLDGKEVEVKQGDMWICFASIEEHSTTPVKGGERLVLSCGALVEAVLAEKVYEAIKTTTPTAGG